MQNFSKNIEKLPLFDGINSEDCAALLHCLGASQENRKKGESIFFAGEPIQSFGAVLSGQVQVIQEDYYGNRSIVANVPSGELFGEAFALAGAAAWPVSVVAAAECSLLFLRYDRIASPCQKACSFHGQFIQNLLQILAQKNGILAQKIRFLSKRTTREKLLAYFSVQAKRTGSGRFIIPFNRQELADFLAVERSAMSAELSKMQREGILRYHKNEFELL